MLKIGYTLKLPEERAQELSSATGVPFKFEIAYKVETFSPKKKEEAIHERLSKYRVYDGKKKTEFFKVSFKKAKYAIDMVVSPPKAPSPPQPLELTHQQKKERLKAVKSVLKEKYENRIKNIDGWIQDLQLFIQEERNILDMRGFIRRKFFREPKETLKTIEDYEIVIQKIQEFKEVYTFEIFLKEHKSIQGVDQIRNFFPSKMLKKYLGLEKRENVEIDNFERNSIVIGVEKIEVDIFKITDSCPFKFKNKCYNVQPGWGSLYRTTHNTFIDWDRAYYSPASNFVSESLYPPSDSYHILSDEEYRKRWQENWLEEWWKKVDPNGYSDSNPFNNYEFNV